MSERKNASRRAAADAPRRAGAPRAATRLRACVVIASLRGFDQLSAHLEPRRVVALLQEFVGAMADVAVAHRAVIDAVLGDGVLLLYGVPVAAPRRSGARRARRGGAAARRRWRCATAGCRPARRAPRRSAWRSASPPARC